jgi:hypothetical protein
LVLAAIDYKCLDLLGNYIETLENMFTLFAVSIR